MHDSGLDIGDVRNYNVITSLPGRTMKTRLVRIGNSQGVRIPRTIIEECGLLERVELRVKGNSVIITPARRLREGWDEAFARMAEKGADVLLLPDDLRNEFDETEWEW
jgi:antitoxin MazE